MNHVSPAPILFLLAAELHTPAARDHCYLPEHRSVGIRAPHVLFPLLQNSLPAPPAWPIPQLSCQGGFLTLLLRFIPSSPVPFPVTETASKSLPVKLFVVRSLVRLSRLLSKVETITCVVQVTRWRLREVQYGMDGWLAHSHTVSKWVRSVPDLCVHSPSSWTEVVRQWPVNVPGNTTLAYPTPGTYGTLPVKLMPQRCSELVTVSPNVGPSAGTNWMMLGGRPAFRRVRYTA